MNSSVYGRILIVIGCLGYKRYVNGVKAKMPTMLRALTLISAVGIALIGQGSGQCSSVLSVTTALYTTPIPTFRSPNFPFAYNDYDDCKWSFTASSSTNRILFTIPSISIERNYDFLSIYDGTSTSSIRLYYSLYYSEPAVALTSGQSAYVTFTSDYSVRYGGFEVSYIEVSSASNACTTTVTANSIKQHVWYTNGNECYITINAGTGNKVRITVLNLFPSDTLIFGDTDGSSYIPITTASVSEYVSLTSLAYVRLVNYVTSFMFTYEEVSSGTNNIVTTSSVNYGLNICSYSSLSATSTVEQVVSPNYPNPYSNSVTCVLTIRATDSSQSVSVVFDDFDLNYDDYLEIFDGVSTQFNSLGSSWYTGSGVNSTGSALTLYFYSGYSGVLRGFQLSYRQVARVVPNCVSSYTTLTASTTIQTLTKGTYTNNEEQYWLIVKPSMTDNLVLDLSVISIEEAESCIYDSLTFYDGACTTDSVIVTMCGYSPATFEDSTGQYVLVMFKTDGSVVKEGFTLNYYIGTYADADASTSNDDDDDGFNKLYYILAIALLFALAFIIAAIGVFIYMRKTKKQRTTIASGAVLAPRPNIHKKTPQQLLSEINEKLNKDAKNQNKPKLQRKTSRMDQYHHPQPAPPGPGVNVIMKSGQPIHPVPSAPPAPPIKPGTSGAQGPHVPTHTPSYDSVDKNGNVHNVDPAFPPGYDPKSYSQPLKIEEGTIPPPFHYITPSEARAMGLQK